jgi:Flp pilus assembly protein TadG
MQREARHSRQKGVSLIVGTLSLVFIIPLVGLIIDLGVLYAAKARLQGAVDGASLAAARALNLGETIVAQATSAQQNAVNWFYANFPTGNWGTTNTQMSSATVLVFDDPNNPQLRDVTVTASTNVPTYFMGWFHIFSTTISAIGNASRRDVVIMMVLDRSGSMNNGTVPSACQTMVSAAKIFTGQFAAGRDRVGLVSFSDSVYTPITPTVNFQTVLGYTNSFGSAVGEIDNIACKGGTATPEGVAVAYNQLYEQNLPGALNVVMLETDGLPNTLTLNFWDSTQNVAGIKAGSSCHDRNGKTINNGGFKNAGSLPIWTSGISLGAGSFFSNIPAGIVGAVYSDDPGGGNQFSVMMNYWSTTEANDYNSTSYLNGTSCSFDGGQWTNSSPDLAWFPTTDVFGNQLNPASNAFLPVTMNGTYVKGGNWTNYHNAVLNATDYAAYQARTNATIPAYFFAIGLGGNPGDPPDYILLQRMANDPNGDNYNNPPLYQPCSQEATCVNYPNQPRGTFIFSANLASLSQAYLSISSQVLRLSK